MAYLYDTLVEALGGSKLIGAQGMDYGNWSPNNYRSVLITLDGILVEGHLGGVKLTKLDLNKAMADIADSRSRNMLNAFELKKFMGLEEVIIDARLTTDIGRFMSSAVDERGRLRAVVVSPFNEMMFKVIASRIQEMRKKSPEALISELFGIQAMTGAPGPSSRDWFSKVTLTAKVYQVDRIGGKLHDHLKKIAEAHGVTLVEEVVVERNYTESQVLNIQAHRENVAADIAADSVGDLEAISQGVSILGKYREAEGADKEGIKLLASGLMEGTKGDVSTTHLGLDFYLGEFGENDSVPVELSDLYFKRGFAGKSEVPSSAKIDIVGGYLQIDKAVKKSVLKVIRSRVERKLYVPDLDLFEPRGENLHEFINLLIGGVFDYQKYSKTLKAIEGVQVGTSLEAYLEKRKAEGGEVALAVGVFEEKISEETKKSPFGFLNDLKLGVAKMSLRAFNDMDKEEMSSQGAEVLVKGVKLGVVALSVKFPPLRKAVPLINKGADFSEQYLIEHVGRLLDSIGTGLEGAVASGSEEDGVSGGAGAEGSEGREEGSGEFEDLGEYSGAPVLESSIVDEPSSDEVVGTTAGLTEEAERRLYEIFETQIFWDFGIKMMSDMLSDCKDFSSLKYRQVERMSRASRVVEGLPEFLEKYKNRVGPLAVPLFKSTGYLEENANSSGKDRLLDPLEFFSKLVDEFANLSKRRVRNKALTQLEHSGGIKWDNMKIYNDTARELMGLRGRVYGFPKGS